MKRIILSILSVYVLISCKSEHTPIASFEEVSYYDSFPQTESLKAEDFKHSIPLSTIDFRIIDTLCIFATNDTDNGFYKLCNLSDFSIKNHVVKKGNGPNELLWYQYFNEMAFRHEADSLVAYLRNNKRQLSRWNVSRTLMFGDVEFVPFTAPFKGSLSSIYINDSLTFVTRLNADDTGIERLIYNGSDVEIPSHLSQLSASEVMRNDGTSFNTLSMITSYDVSHDKVVEVGTSQNIINIYTLDGTFRKSVCVGGLCEYDVDDAMSWPMAYEHMDLCQDFIAALYYDDTTYNHSVNGEVLPSIRILTWEGLPVLELLLDRHATNFEFDFRNKKLYTLNAADESFNQYDISFLYGNCKDLFRVKN